MKKKDALIYSSQGTVGVGSSFKVETDFRAWETLLLRELELELEMNKSKTTTQKLGESAWHIYLKITFYQHFSVLSGAKLLPLDGPFESLLCKNSPSLYSPGHHPLSTHVRTQSESEHTGQFQGQLLMFPGTSVPF